MRKYKPDTNVLQPIITNWKDESINPTMLVQRTPARPTHTQPQSMAIIPANGSRNGNLSQLVPRDHSKGKGQRKGSTRRSAFSGSFVEGFGGKGLAKGKRGRRTYQSQQNPYIF